MKTLLGLLAAIALVAACTTIPLATPSASPGSTVPATAVPSPTQPPTQQPSEAPTATSEPGATASAAYEQLLQHVPESMRADCMEVTSFDAGFIVGVQCINIPSVDGYITYYQFDTVENMNASYQDNLEFFGPDSDGTSCQMEASEIGYTIDGAPAGRLMCADYEDGLIATWTHEGFAISSTIVLFDGTYPELYGIWQAAGPDPATSRPPSPSSVTWSATASEHGGEIGKRVVYACPAGGSLSTIWGTDVYTDDSSVCTAAVHAGLITLAAGGTVTIEMRSGQNAYVASERNGITSSQWGNWDSSFVFVIP